MKLILIIAALAVSALAQTRPVNLTWNASTSTGVIGYNVYRSTSTTGPFTTPLNTSPVSGTSFQDLSAVIGQVYTYVVSVLAAPCTPTTPVTTACGQGPSSNPATTTIPQIPAATTTVVVSVP